MKVTKLKQPHFCFGLGDCSTMDVAILVDRSRSMQTYQRNSLVTLINKFVDKIGVSEEGNHFAVGTFGPSAGIYNNLKAPEATNVVALKKQIKKRVKYVPGDWGTRTDLAMKQANTLVFTSGGGDRPKAANVLLVFTDGKPLKTAKDKNPWVEFEDSTKQLEVSFFSVKIRGQRDMHRLNVNAGEQIPLQNDKNSNKIIMNRVRVKLVPISYYI